MFLLKLNKSFLLRLHKNKVLWGEAELIILLKMDGTGLIWWSAISSDQFIGIMIWLNCLIKRKWTRAEMSLKFPFPKSFPKWAKLCSDVDRCNMRQAEKLSITSVYFSDQQVKSIRNARFYTWTRCQECQTLKGRKLMMPFKGFR